MKKNFLITTGGSGGHVVPAKILFEHLSKENNLILSTDKRGLKYLDKDIYKVEIVDTPKLGNIILLPFNLTIILFLILKSFFLLKKKKNWENFFYGGIYVYTNNFGSQDIEVRDLPGRAQPSFRAC